MRIRLHARTFLCIFSVVLLLAAGVFWRPLIAHLAHWSLQGYCLFCLQSSFTTDEVTVKNGAVVFTNPSFKNTSSDQPWLQGKAAEMAIYIQLQPFNGRASVDFHLSTPHIKITAPQDEFSTLFSFSGTPGSHIDTRFSIENGLLAIKDKPANSFTDFAFSGSGSLDEMRFTLSSQDGGYLKAVYDDREWQLECNDLNFAQLDHALKVLGLSVLPADIHQGKLEGEISIDWDEEDLPDVHGILQVKECIFANTSGDVHGYIPEASLLLNDSSLSGKFTLGKGAYLEYNQEGRQPISLSRLEGSLSLPAYDSCMIQAQGLCTHHGSSFDLTIDGNINVHAQGRASCELEVILKNEAAQPVRACISSIRESFGHSQCTLDVQNIGAGEWDLLMIALGTQDIGLDPYTLRDGLIDARIKLDLEHFKVKKINIEEFVAKQVAFDLDQSDVFISIDNAHGSLSLDVSAPSILETLQASFGINGGMVRFPALNKQQWQLSNLVTELFVENGALKKSFVEADFMGLRGMIEVDWASKKAMNMQFQGGVRNLAALASSNVQKGVMKKFKDDDLKIVADVWRVNSGLNVEGVIELNSPEADRPDVIQMGFMLEKTAGCNLLSPSAVLFTKRLGADIIEALVKQMSKDKDEPAAEWLKQELRIAGFVLKNGWFNAAGLPTEKYIQPFFFKEDQMTLNGEADFLGRFDCDGLAVEYQGSNIVLENDDLSFQMGEIGLNQPARHYFDFLNDTDQGVVPVTNGTYFEKNSGLLYVDVEGSMILKDKTIHIPAIETTCNNVFFAGTIDVDYSSPAKKVFDVEVEMRTMEGSYSHVRDLLSHFKQTANFAELPLEGKISLKEPGGALRFAFRPSGCQVNAIVHGRMEEGVMDSPLSGISLSGIGCDFDYDHEANRLNIKNITAGVVLKGESRPAFEVCNGYAHFLDLEEGLIEFDVSLLNESTEIFRLAGSTEKINLTDQDPLLHLVVNKEYSHYGGIAPDKFEILLNSSRDVEAVDFQWKCNLAGTFQEIQKTGEVLLQAYSTSLAKQWGNLQAPGGDVLVKVQYDNPTSQLNFHLEGYDFKIENASYKHIVLAGAKKRNVWSIEQLQVDDIALAADILPQPGGYKVNFLGLRCGNMLLMGLDGFYNTEKAVFNANINLVDVNFSQLNQWPLFHELVSDYHPQGTLKGSGTLQVTMTDQWPPHTEINLKTSLRGCTLRNLHFDDADNVACEFVYKDKLVLTGCKSGLKSSDSGCTQGLFGVEKAIYDFKKEELALQGLHFHAHATNLDWIAGKLQQEIPEAITPAIAEIIRHVKEDETFRGSMDVRISDDEANIVMRLPQGKYKLGAKEHEVNNFVLEWDKKTLQVVAQYRFQNTLYWVTVKSSSPDVDAGDIIVSAYPPDHSHQMHSDQCLNIAWYMHPQYGMVVEKAHGRLPGLTVDLVRDRLYPMNPYSWHLDGHIVLDPKIGQHVLPTDIVEAIASWNIAHDYTLDGKWIFMLEAPHEGELYFQGQLTGQDVVLKGYRVGNISAELNCSPEQIQMQSLILQDPAGKLSIESSSMIKQPDGDWWVYIPKVVGEHFRPSLLREIETPAGPPKALVIPRFEIQDIVCRANDLSTMSGTGKLTFNNSSKRPLHNPLLAIPVEIISRIGLNLDVLNPVSGNIFFEIEDYKVKLMKFKDVYSEGKLSKFYLPHTNYSSYVDLDGNVHVQVRMKQYNLLFKLAELFTVTIHGSLQKPVYTLQKQ